MNADAQNQELMWLYRIRKTVLKMLAKRGYNVLEQTLKRHHYPTFHIDTQHP